MRRTYLFLLLALLLMGVGRAALGVTPPVIKVTRVEPAIDAVRSSGGTTIELRDPKAELVLFDLKGEPWLRMTAAGVFERNAKGEFEAVRTEPFFYIHDGHIARQVLEQKALPYPWRMQGTYGGQTFTMEGTFIPPGTTADATEPPAGVTPLGWLAAALAVLGFGIWLFRRVRT